MGELGDVTATVLPVNVFLPNAGKIYPMTQHHAIQGMNLHVSLN